MGLLDSMLQSQGGAAVQQLGRRFGLTESQVEAALAQLVPALSKGVKTNTAQPGGMESLLAALTSGKHTSYLDRPETLSRPEAIADGNAILGHLLGSKDASRAVAARASADTGIGQDILKQMLPLAAAMVMGALGKQHQAGASKPSSLLSMLDADGDGSAIDDLLGMARKFLK